MVGGPGLRFALEAAFLIVLAVAAGAADLEPATIVIVMAAAWALVAAIEWLSWQEGPRVTRRRELAERPLVEAPGLEPEPLEQSRRGWRFWRRSQSAPAADAGASSPDEDTADFGVLPEEPAAAARVDEGSRT